MITVDVGREGAQPRGRRGGPRRAARPLDPARAALHDRRLGQVRGARLVGVRGRGHERRAAPPGARGPRRGDRRLGGPTRWRCGSRSRPRRSASTGRRSTPPGARRASCGGLGRRLDERPPHRHGPGRAGAVARGAHAARDARPPRARACASGTRAVEHVPPPGARSRRRRRSWTTRRAAGSSLGLGAGWFEGEHEPFGIPLPPIGERIDRLISAVEVLQALFSPEAAAAPGVTRPDPFYPLAGAVNAPAPLTPGGPPIFLGGQKPRGIALAARRGGRAGCCTGTEAGDVAYFTERRDAILRALEAEGRDPAGFEIVGQVHARRRRRRRGRGRWPRRGRWSARARRRW